MTSLIFGWDAPASRRPMGFVPGQDIDGEACQPGDSRLIEDSSDSHMMIVAPAGAGKGRSVAIPNLLHWDGPAIVLDVKGELASVTADYRRQLKQNVVILDPWRIATQTPSSLNPLSILQKAGDGLIDQAYSMASMLGDPMASPRDPFWNERAENLIAGAITHVVTGKTEKDRSFRRVWELINAENALNQLSELLDENEDMHPFARRTFGGLCMTADATRSGILSTAQSYVRVFASELVQQAVETTDVDLDAVTEGAPMTIYVVVPPSKLRSHASLLRLWISALLSLITDRRKGVEKPTLLVLDEMAQLGPMEQVRSAVTLMRGYGLRAMLFLQSYAQLRRLYGDHESLMENCASIVTFGHNARSMSMQFADMLGDVSADMLFRMERDRVAVKTAGHDTRIARKLDYLSDPLFSGRARPHPMFGKD